MITASALVRKPLLKVAAVIAHCLAHRGRLCRSAWLAGLLACSVIPQLAARDITGAQAHAEKLVHAVAPGHAPGAAVVVLHAGKPLASAAAGWADPSRDVPMTAETPLRIASVTKPYVAATLLRLADQTGTSLDALLAPLLPQRSRQALLEGGFALDAITLRQVLSHTAGLPSHSSSLYYKAISFLFRGWEWSAADQVRLMAGAGGPLSRPGERYRYSDTGYVLLGQVVETLSGKALHAAVREQVDYRANGLSQTWWDHFEQPPAGSLPRARQYLSGWDISGLNATRDLYGGGGLVASTRDMARFFAALFSPANEGGQIFRSPALLNEMVSAKRLPAHSAYRLGVRVGDIRGVAAYRHVGIWGTLAIHLPEQDISIGVAVTEREAIPVMREAVADLIAGLTAPSGNR